MAEIFDKRVCTLGEGPLWHPERHQFFWFDILASRLLSVDQGAELEWRFKHLASAAGWVDHDHLLVAHEKGLGLLDLSSGELEPVADVEADNDVTRSNDGRADRQGGFWFGTMGKSAEPEAGAIYRFYKGDIRRVFDAVTIPNAICFSVDGKTAYFADTALATIWSQPLDTDGWPDGERKVFLDCKPMGLDPDGAVVDRDGAIWVACWGAGAVVRFGQDMQELERVNVGGRHSSCPAFGGHKLNEMLVTTATQGIDHPDPAQGLTYLVQTGFQGLPEPRVIL